MLDTVLEAVDGRRPVVMGLGSHDTRHALRALTAIARRPLAGVLTVAPYYTRPSQAGIEAHFRAIAAASALPLILYNIPYPTAVNIDLATVKALADVPTIVAIKESGGNLDQLMDLVWCPVNNFTQPFDLGEDRFCGGGPHERPRMLVVVLDERVDLALEVGDRVERAAADGLVGD